MELSGQSDLLHSHVSKAFVERVIFIVIHWFFLNCWFECDVMAAMSVGESPLL